MSAGREEFTANETLNLSSAAKEILLAMMRSLGEVTLGTVGTIAATASTIVKNAIEMEGDAASAAKGAVQGAIEGAKEIGINPELAASAAATGAVQAGYDAAGAGMGVKIRNAVSGTISGVHVRLHEPFGTDKKKQK